MVGKDTRICNAYRLLPLLILAVIIMTVGCSAEDIGSLTRHKIPAKTDITLNTLTTEQLSTWIGAKS